MIMQFCSESPEKTYAEVQVDRQCQLINGFLRLTVTLTIPSDALQLCDKSIRVFGENLHPNWGQHRTNSGRVKIAPKHELTTKSAIFGTVAHDRVKTLTVTLDHDDPEEIVTKTQETFREIVNDIRKSLSAYFEKQVKVLRQSIRRTSKPSTRGAC